MRTPLKALTTALVIGAGALTLSACVADPYAYDQGYYGNSGYGYSSPSYAYAPSYNTYVAPRYSPPPRVIYRDRDYDRRDWRDRRRHDHDRNS